MMWRVPSLRRMVLQVKVRRAAVEGSRKVAR